MDNNSSDGCYGIDSEFLYKAYAGLNIMMGIVACLFAVFALVVLFLLDKHVFYKQRLLIYLNIALFLGGLVSATSVNPFLNDYLTKKSDYCTINGFLYNWATLTELLIIWLITVDVFRLAISKNKLFHPQRSLEITLILVTFFLPPLVLWVPAIPSISLYGPDGPLCDFQTLDYNDCHIIDDGFKGLAAYRFAPFLISFIVLSVLLITGTCKLRKEGTKSLSYNPQQREMATVHATVWQLQLYPLLYFVFSIAPILHFAIVQGHGPDQLILATYFFYIVGNNVRGILLSLAFLFNKDTRACLSKIKTIKQIQSLFRREHNVVVSYNDSPSLYTSHGDSLDAKEYKARRKHDLMETLIQNE